MEIKFKYNLGEIVWWLGNHKAQEGYIYEMNFHKWHDNSETKEYVIKHINKSETSLIHEDFLFPTKEELLKSL